MATLTSEREKAQLEPVTEAIFAQQLIVETLTGSNHHRINQASSFKVILVDKKGNKVSREVTKLAVKNLAVGVTGPSKVKVHCFTFYVVAKFVPFSLKSYFCPFFLTVQATVEEKGQVGGVFASFTPSQTGQHHVCVTFRGKQLQGSPFTLEVVDHPIYR